IFGSLFVHQVTQGFVTHVPRQHQETRADNSECQLFDSLPAFFLGIDGHPPEQRGPDTTSMKLSTPNPTSDILPGIAPAATAKIPSRLFQAIVKYSSRLPRSAMARRSKTISDI